MNNESRLYIALERLLEAVEPPIDQAKLERVREESGEVLYRVARGLSFEPKTTSVRQLCRENGVADELYP